ncbi:IS630 family transposase [Rhizophagus irregularis DAOM 181602=DAOM 197198]|nr:IS630 family transposase [Rhizophagus irregularis DAOM 181602=DAOM 197198]
MVKKRELTDFERGKVIGFYEAGDSERAISNKTGYGKTTIHNIIAKYRETGAVTVAPRSGCPKKLTERDKRHLKAIINKNRREPEEKIRKIFMESTGNDVGRRTIQRTLYGMGYNSCAALRKPCVSECNRKIRLNWARERRLWTINDWKKIVWSDESRFTMFQNDGKIRVWRLQKEKYDINYLVPTMKHGGGGVMMWGCFTWFGLGPLVRIDGRVNSQRYIEEILGYHVIPFLERFEEENGDYLFQQDNAPIHTSARTREFCEEMGINLLSWPGQSPDLNPIEHLWDELERRIRAKQNHPKNLGELEELLQECWSEISCEVYQKLVESMNRRIEAVIKARGYPTRY